MRYCFILGRSPLLSAAEICAVLTSHSFSLLPYECGADILELKCDTPIDVHSLMDRLGGTIKIGEYLETIPVSDFTAHTIERHITEDTRRITCGISVCSLSQNPKKGRLTAQIIKRLLLKLKNRMKDRGISFRAVVAQKDASALSSVVVEKNKLCKPSGYEFIVIMRDSSYALYRTRVVQPFESFSHHDYARPIRSMAIGMLPPKIARIMVNLAITSTPSNITLLDPFCGTGTILEQAALIGVPRCIGSDISAVSLNAAKKNWHWLKAHEEHARDCATSFILSDVARLNAHILQQPITAIATEGYLGRPMSRNSALSRSEIDAIEKIYEAAFRSFRTLLSPQNRICVALPFWFHNYSRIFLPTIKERIKQLGFIDITHSLLSPHMRFCLTTDGFLWHREKQRTGRMILVFQLAKRNTHTSPSATI